MDGKFKYNEEEISYKITDDASKGIKVYRGIEKMCRSIHFYNPQKKIIGTRCIYGTVEEMTNISQQDALKWYEQFLHLKNN